VQPAPHLRLVAMRGDEAGQGTAGVREQHVALERDATGGAFVVGDDGAGHSGAMKRSTPRAGEGRWDVPADFQCACGSKRGNRWAMSVPVKWPTQPSGSVKKRMATKFGCGPMSNQWRVPPGTAIRSSFTHSTS